MGVRHTLDYKMKTHLVDFDALAPQQLGHDLGESVLSRHQQRRVALVVPDVDDLHACRWR